MTKIIDNPKIKNYEVNDKIKLKKYGTGKVVLVDKAPEENSAYIVYHVELPDGSVRHFTENDIS